MKKDEGFQFACEIEVRWMDLDPLGHVNNAVLVSYLEQARVRIWQDIAKGSGVKEIPFVVARVEVDYLRPIFLGQRVVVKTKLAEVGRTSFVLEYDVEADGKRCASAKTVMVSVDSSGRPVPVPESLLSVF